MASCSIGVRPQTAVVNREGRPTAGVVNSYEQSATLRTVLTILVRCVYDANVKHLEGEPASYCSAKFLLKFNVRFTLFIFQNWSTTDSSNNHNVIAIIYNILCQQYLQYNCYLSTINKQLIIITNNYYY